MNTGGKRRVESVTYSHDLSTGSLRLVDRFRQVIHIGAFHCVLESDVLVVYPLDDFASLGGMQEVLVPLLRAWELHSELRLGRALRFRKASHKVRDLETGGQRVGIGTACEQESAQRVIAVTITDRVKATDIAFAGAGRVDKPEVRPLEFSEPVEAARDRWRDVVDKRERLLVGAYWILTNFYEHYGSKTAAARGLNVAKAVLTKVGELTAVSDPHEGRKRKGELRSLRDAERVWLQEAIPILIYRFAEAESGYKDLPQITKTDLPPLCP